MRRGGPVNRGAVLPVPPPQMPNGQGTSDRSEDSEPSKRNPRAPAGKPQLDNNGVAGGPSFGPSASGNAPANRAAMMGKTSMIPGSSRSDNGQSSDRYASSASSVPDEMIRKASHDSITEPQSQDEDDDDDENEKLKVKKKMIKVYHEYKKSYPERYDDRKAYFQKVAESDVLSRFQKPTPETLVECGYNTEHHNARLKKLETASFILHFLGFFFSIGYYELNYNQIYEDFQIYVLYTLHGISLYLGMCTD